MVSAVTEKPATDSRPVRASLDDLDPDDRKIVALIATVRRTKGEGPTWSELRRAMGYPNPVSHDQFSIWWRENRDEYRRSHPWAHFRAEHLDLNKTQARSAYQQQAKNLWKRSLGQDDPLRPRLKRLCRLKYVKLTNQERSLDLGPAALDLARRRSTPRR